MKTILALAAIAALGIGTATSAENCGVTGADLGVGQCDGGNLRPSMDGPEGGNNGQQNGNGAGGDSGRQD